MNWYFDELPPDYMEWAQGLASPGNALKELADFAREQEEAGLKKRKREGEDEGGVPVSAVVEADLEPDLADDLDEEDVQQDVAA